MVIYNSVLLIVTANKEGLPCFDLHIEQPQVTSIVVIKYSTTEILSKTQYEQGASTWTSTGSSMIRN